MKILLIGRTGQLGGEVLRRFVGHEIHAPSREALDVTDAPALRAAISALAPDAVVNTAAFHDVPRCEAEPDAAFRVNCVAVRDLAVACREAGAVLVTFSSDYVFGGEKRVPYTEDDRPAPLQIYGITRLAGELAAVSAAPESTIIVRTCGLYGASGGRSRGGNFVDKRIRDAQAATRLEMSCEQVVAPTSAEDLAAALRRLLEHPGRRPGIYHLVNEGQCSWHEFTKAIYELAGLGTEVVPVDRRGMTGGMRRPLYSVLANTRARALGIVLPHWRDALARYLRTRYGTPAP